MELYLDVKTVGKGDKGRTACGSSAYRACEKIIDNAGNQHDFSRKGGHVAGGVILPAGAPEELLDRQTLWQRHDQKEIRKDAQIFRETEMSLHNSLSYDAAERVCVKIGQKLADMGMCVQWDIHDKVNKKGERNLHAHFMSSMRDLLEDGTFGNKNRSWNKYNGGMNLADVLRPYAAELMNAELDKIGVADRVEHESFIARGIDRIPTVHIGVVGCAMEEKGIITYKVALNKRIREINEEHVAYIIKLENYRQLRDEYIRKAKQEAEFSLEERTRKANTMSLLGEPKEGDREGIYEAIKKIDIQRAGVKKDKKRIQKLRQALYIVKNLAGEPDLDQEQNDKLEWAVNYLQWAGFEDLSPKAVYQAIEEYREYNTECWLKDGELLGMQADLYEAMWEEPKSADPRPAGPTFR